MANPQFKASAGQARPPFTATAQIRMQTWHWNKDCDWHQNSGPKLTADDCAWLQGEENLLNPGLSTTSMVLWHSLWPWGNIPARQLGPKTDPGDICGLGRSSQALSQAMGTARKPDRTSHCVPSEHRLLHHLQSQLVLSCSGSSAPWVESSQRRNQRRMPSQRSFRTFQDASGRSWHKLENKGQELENDEEAVNDKQEA